MINTIQTTTVQTWANLSSKDSKQLGNYSFRDHTNYSYSTVAIATANLLTKPTLHNILNQAGKTTQFIRIQLTSHYKHINKSYGELLPYHRHKKIFYLAYKTKSTNKNRNQ